MESSTLHTKYSIKVSMLFIDAMCGDSYCFQAICLCFLCPSFLKCILWYSIDTCCQLSSQLQYPKSPVTRGYLHLAPLSLFPVHRRIYISLSCYLNIYSSDWHGKHVNFVGNCGNTIKWAWVMRSKWKAFVKDLATDFLPFTRTEIKHSIQRVFSLGEFCSHVNIDCN